MNNRCSYQECNRKLLLSDLSCRCENRFCILHRLPENHKCTFDYKNLGKEILRKTLIGEKKELL